MNTLNIQYIKAISAITGGNHKVILPLKFVKTSQLMNLFEILSAELQDRDLRESARGAREE